MVQWIRYIAIEKVGLHLCVDGSPRRSKLRHLESVLEGHKYCPGQRVPVYIMIPRRHHDGPLNDRTRRLRLSGPRCTVRRRRCRLEKSRSNPRLLLRRRRRLAETPVPRLRLLSGLCRLHRRRRRRRFFQGEKEALQRADLYEWSTGGDYRSSLPVFRLL
jgi:hypothetical protein